VGVLDICPFEAALKNTAFPGISQYSTVAAYRARIQFSPILQGSEIRVIKSRCFWVKPVENRQKTRTKLDSMTVCHASTN